LICYVGDLISTIQSLNGRFISKEGDLRRSLSWEVTPRGFQLQIRVEEGFFEGLEAKREIISLHLL